jgi:hypothetical protein
MAEETAGGRTAARRGRGRRARWLAAAVTAGVVAWPFAHLATGRTIEAPAWVTARIEAEANRALAGSGELRLGGVAAALAEGWAPRLEVRDLAYFNAAGRQVAAAPEVRLTLAADAALRGRMALTGVEVSGGELRLRRDATGRFGLALGPGLATAAEGALPAVLAAVDAALARPELARVQALTAEALRVRFEDETSGRSWSGSDGRLALVQEPGGLRFDLSLGIAGQGGKPAEVALSAFVPSGGGEVALTARLGGVGARDLAAEVPALAFLASAEAPLAAALEAGFARSGRLERLAGRIRLGEGRITPAGGAPPVRFAGAEGTVVYHPGARRLAFDGVSVRTDAAAFRAEGQALLQAVDPVTGRPGALVVQLGLADVWLDPAGALGEPARFASGSADLRVTLDPFRVEIGELVLIGDAGPLRLWGEVAAGPGGWAAALDLRIAAIEAGRLLALWPLGLVPRTRDWLAANVERGRLIDLAAALRREPGAPERLALSYGFEGAAVRVLPSLPPLVDAAGRASLTDGRFALELDAGRMTAPGGEAVDLAGSHFVVPDVTIPGAPAEVGLAFAGPIRAVLGLLDLPPFRVLAKAGRGPDLAEGSARGSATIRLPLIADLPPEAVDFAASGELQGVRSTVLVPGRVLAAPRLTFAADRETLTIAGPGRIGQAAFDAVWAASLAPGAAGSRIEGTVTLDQAFLDEFRIALPRGTIGGAGSGQFVIDLPGGGAAPAFRLVSDLNRLALSIPALGWSKPAAGTGRLEVAGRLGSPATIERLVLRAPGLEAEGQVALAPDGSFREARFARLRAGGWLDAPVRLVARPGGQAAAVHVEGGRIDLTAARAPGRGGGGPVTLTLDRLIVAEGIEFRQVAAELTAEGGLSGRFTARLGGTVPVSGTLAPTGAGTAVRLQSDDAGAVLRAVRLLDSARQGRLDLTLLPLPGEGRYDGRVRITDLGLRGAPVLAELLSAVSVVGLLEQLNGQGIVFGEVTGEFLLEPEGITLTRGSAIGASLGVSMSGIYDLRSRRLDMRGVISPLYLLNSVGAVLTRRGEGLFGFTYRMTGPAARPRTEVNPLSILTPGMLREIFRGAPPRLTQ